MKRLAVVVAVISLACRGGDGDDDEARVPSRVHGRAVILDDQARATLELAVAPVREAELPDIRVRYGRVAARPGDELVIAAPLVGQVTAVAAVAIGDRVTAGQELVRVGPVLGASERAALGVQTAEIGAQVAQAEQEVRLREAELTRTRDLAKDGIASQAKLQEAEAAVTSARARLAAARQGRQAQAGALGRAVSLKSPADGTLIALDAVVGGGVETGRPLARVLRGGARRIDLSVGASDPIATAYEVHVDERWLPARLVARGTTIAEDGNRHDLIELEPGAEPLLGSTVEVRLATAQTRGLVVPESAVLSAAGGDIVYVEGPHGTFEPHLVQITARFGGRVRVARGLAAGDAVVVRGVAALRGEAVRAALGNDED
ncbi:MAG TPA: hypothetical protein VFQ53_36220 [Kofleriaceae bacterium]|nr:hypothetical protein [Kofleriaceae bacterium]